MAEPEATELRVGLGFDSHPRAPERLLRLGGVAFEGEDGLAGHSDADVVCHALADALLGAAALGDIGEHFPDTDPAFEGMAGSELLGRVVELVRGRGLRPVSCDVVLVIDRPAIGPRREEMRTALAEVLGAAEGRVSVKAKRPEGLALAGEGAACMAIAVVAP